MANRFQRELTPAEQEARAAADRRRARISNIAIASFLGAAVVVYVAGEIFGF